MKISLDPMPTLRLAAVESVNEHFNRLAIRSAHRDQAHKQKRDLAAAIVAGVTVEADHPFAKEAGLRGVSVEQLAQTISSKPDMSAERELERQRLLLTIEAAASPADIAAVTSLIDIIPGAA